MIRLGPTSENEKSSTIVPSRCTAWDPVDLTEAFDTIRLPTAAELTQPRFPLDRYPRLSDPGV